MLQFLARRAAEQRPSVYDNSAANWADAARQDWESLQQAGRNVMANTQAAAQANQASLLPQPSSNANWLQRALYNATAHQANAGVHLANLAQGALGAGLQAMEENPEAVQSWMDPLEGPSRALGAAVAGQNPFVDGRIEGPLISEALSERGVHPLLAMAAEFFVPDPLGATRALDIIPMLGVIAGFRGLRSLVPGAANDVEAIRAIIKGSPNLSGTYLELTDPDAAMQVASAIYANAGNIPDQADAAAALRAADRLTSEALGVQYTASRQVVPVNEYQPGHGADILASLGASGQIADIPRATVRRDIYNDLVDAILELPASGWTGGADPEADARILRVLEAASALPDAKGHVASVALQQIAQGGPNAGLHAADALDALGVALGHEVLAINSNLSLARYEQEMQILVSGDMDRFPLEGVDVVDRFREDIQQLANSSAERLLQIANADHPGSSLSGISMRHYQRAIDEAERMLDELDSFVMASDAAMQVPRTLDESVALMADRMGLAGSSAEEHLALWADRSGSRDELRSLVGQFLDNPVEVDQVTDYLWSGMRVDPLTGATLPRLGSAAELRPDALRSMARDAAGSLGISVDELANLATDGGPAEYAALVDRVQDALGGVSPERVDAMLDLIGNDLIASERIARARQLEDAYKALFNDAGVSREELQRIMGSGALSDELARTMLSRLGVDESLHTSILADVGHVPAESPSTPPPTQGTRPILFNSDNAGDPASLTSGSPDLLRDYPLSNNPADIMDQRIDWAPMVERVAARSNYSRRALVDGYREGGEDAIRSALSDVDWWNAARDGYASEEEAFRALIDDLKRLAGE